MEKPGSWLPILYELLRPELGFSIEHDSISLTKDGNCGDGLTNGRLFTALARNA